MAKSTNDQIPNSCTTRREFCRKVPCAAVGFLASYPILTSIAEGSNTPEKNMLPKEHIMANNITLKVISQKGTCDAGHKVGDEITITENGVKGKICIHALYSFLPKAFAMMFDANFPWLQDPDVSTSACPDASNPVIFQLTRKKG